MNVIEFADCCCLVRADVAELQVTRRHGLQPRVALLFGHHSVRSRVNQIALHDIVDANVDASSLLHSQLVGFLVGSDHVEPDSIVLCNGSQSVDHVHVAHREQCDWLLPGRTAHELVEARMLFREVKHLRKLLVHKLGHFGFELVVRTKEAEAHFLNQRKSLELWIFE